MFLGYRTTLAAVAVLPHPALSAGQGQGLSQCWEGAQEQRALTWRFYFNNVKAVLASGVLLPNLCFSLLELETCRS